MLQDEFKPIPHKVLTIGRSPKESVIAIPKANFALSPRWVKKITYKVKGGVLGD
ncbi:hypothetical protein [Streptococcus ovis]|uniref:hypothetical protein n=1 Tax=Streptococcus ovis TaxID=82806 RepID=UPI00036AC789|nr:hypothetical protein [Streptococcus ovis]